jgi:hypothetical protein
VSTQLARGSPSRPVRSCIRLIGSPVWVVGSRDYPREPNGRPCECGTILQECGVSIAARSARRVAVAEPYARDKRNRSAAQIRYRAQPKAASLQRSCRETYPPASARADPRQGRPQAVGRARHVWSVVRGRRASRSRRELTTGAGPARDSRPALNDWGPCVVSRCALSDRGALPSDGDAGDYQREESPGHGATSTTDVTTRRRCTSSRHRSHRPLFQGEPGPRSIVCGIRAGERITPPSPARVRACVRWRRCWQGRTGADPGGRRGWRRCA